MPRVKVRRGGRVEKDVSLEARSVRELLKELDLPADWVLVIRGEELLTPDEPLRPEDEIEIRFAVSGGGG